jgi:hypothetical protein
VSESNDLSTDRRRRWRLGDQAISPRIAIAWSRPNRDLVLRASYGRAFQTLAVENLLLASSPALEALSSAVVRLPVRPSRGKFYEAGFSKRLSPKLRVDANHYRRTMSNFADDDLLLHTGVSFPIAFREATVEGTEVKVNVPQWGPFSATVAYSNMIGFGYLPVTGGLLLGEDTASALASARRFPVSQDQRDTVSARGSWQLSPRG